MPYENFLLTRSGLIATVTFNRPEKLNPINELVTRELLAIVQELHEDEETRVVILTGAGRAFSVGGDMEMFAEGWTQPISANKAIPPSSAWKKWGGG